MSEEEKKAIKNMKIFARVHEDMTIVTAEDMDVVLKLVEKLQKENEELETIKSGIKHLETNCVSDDTYYLITKNDFLKGDYKHLLDDYVSKEKLKEKLEQIMYETEIYKEDCYICKALKEKGGYKYKKDWTSIAVMKGDNGRYRVFAWGDGEASISCNYCPHCGKRIEE